MEKELCVCEYIRAPIRSYIVKLAVWQKVYYYMITMSLVTFLMASISRECECVCMYCISNIVLL